MSVQLTVKEYRTNTGVKLKAITYEAYFIISNTQSVGKPYFIEEGELLERERKGHVRGAGI
jgi:hypothetical protein